MDIDVAMKKIEKVYRDCKLVAFTDISYGLANNYNNYNTGNNAVFIIYLDGHEINRFVAPTWQKAVERTLEYLKNV